MLGRAIPPDRIPLFMLDYRRLTMLAAIGLLVGCGAPRESTGPLAVVWTDISSDLAMPQGIEVFAGTDEDAPLNAWVARIDVHQPGIDIQVIASDDEDGRESVSDMVREAGACVGVNGGYFRENEVGFEHIGLLISKGNFVHSAIPGVIVDDTRYPVRRSTLGLSSDNRARIGWVSSKDDSSFWWSRPVPNLAGVPYSQEDSLAGSFWKAQDAVSAGPMLIVDGMMDVATDEEVFFQTTIPDVHPRTAAGIDEEGRLLLMIVDGRQRSSRGVSLEELANLMLEFDALDALNLDGGGSSTFIVRDELLNKPAGATYQREVVSGIVVVCP